MDIYNNPEQSRVVQYDKERMLKSHSRSRHEYLIAQSVLKADVIINLPKLKTHKRAGLTCALKNLVGVNGSKDCLPHHRKGSIEEGGDEYLNKDWRKRIISDLEEKIMETTDIKRRWVFLNAIKFLHGSRHLVRFKDPYSHGSWWGNETIGRMVVDINRAVLYADKSGRLCPTQQRAYFTLVDAVVAGEGEGPLHPTTKPCGFIFGGVNPVAVDLVGCSIMGFNWEKIPTVQVALSDLSPYSLCDFRANDVYVCIDGMAPRSLEDVSRELDRQFVPPQGWLPIVKTVG